MGGREGEGGQREGGRERERERERERRGPPVVLGCKGHKGRVRLGVDLVWAGGASACSSRTHIAHVGVVPCCHLGVEGLEDPGHEQDGQRRIALPDAKSPTGERRSANRGPAQRAPGKRSRISLTAGPCVDPAGLGSF